MKELPTWLKDYLLKRYANSSYALFLQMKIVDLHEGEIIVSMRVRPELTNSGRILHGGAVGSLLDMAMNLACFSTGRRVSVLGFNTNFLSGAKEGKMVRAVARVLHSGKSTMVVEGRVIDSRGKLLAKGRGTFLTAGHFTPEDQPIKRAWSSEPPGDPRGEAREEAKFTDLSRGAGRQQWLKELLLDIHRRNYFAQYLGMEIVNIGEGNTVVSMLVTHRHTNIRGVVHGGALVSLVDTSMMLACASLGKRTVTLDLDIGFLRRVQENDTVKAFPTVIHRGESTMVVTGSILGEGGELLAQARGTFFVIGEFTPGERPPS